MAYPPSGIGQTKYSYRNAWLIALAWTILIGLSLAANAFSERERVLELAKAEARANLNKDKAFRLWATSKGGFYIPVSDHAQPSPFLANLPSRDIKTVEGKVLTLFNPATVIKETGEQFQELSGVQARITNKVYLNPENAPDEWEVKALSRFDEGIKEITEVAQIAGDPYLRVMQPMRMEAGCLKCHAGKPGGVGGATGVSIPLRPYYDSAGAAISSLTATHSGIWMIGLGLIGFITRRTRQYDRERTAAENELRKLSRAVEESATSIIITNERTEIQFVNAKFCETTGFSAEEVLGKSTDILQDENDGRLLGPSKWDVLRAGKEWRGEYRSHKKDGSHWWCLESISRITDEAGQITHFICVREDISERKRAEETIAQLAYYDPLTNLPNRRQFRKRLEQAAAYSRRSNCEMALFYIDADRFKTINDTLGHGAGDALLITLAKRLRDGMQRDTDVVARLGGDEFAVIVFDSSRGTAAEMAQKLVDAMRQPMLIEGNELHVTTSVGVSMYPNDTDDIDELVKLADIALYDAKAHGKNTFRFYSKSANVPTLQHLKLENDLRNAVAREELFLEYQPQIDLRNNAMFGVEALVRWQHPTLGRLMPDCFIKLAEETRLIIPVGAWVLRTALRQLKAWDQAGLPPLTMSVNLSALQLCGYEVVDLIKEVLAETEIAPDRLELEITETMLIEAPDETSRILHEIRAVGVRISIDDFGTGFSSLNYLRHLPVNGLKIDRAFVNEINVNASDKAIAETIISLARGMAYQIIAEGVETEKQLNTLLELGCECAQGYLFSHPIGTDALTRILEKYAADGLSSDVLRGARATAQRHSSIK